MNPLPSFVGPLVCVLTVATAQLLFKYASGVSALRDPLAQPKGLLMLGLALALMGGATLFWVALLRSAPLSRIYPVMAFSFMLVPLGALVFFREHVTLQYWVGVALIVAGVALTARSAVP